MQLIDDLIDLLSSDTSSIENALIKAQVLAHRLGDADFKQWVNDELKGYPKSIDLPPYRVLPITIMGTCSNGAYRYSDQVLPLMHLDDGIREMLTTKKLTQSIAVIESWSKDEKDLSVVVAPEFYPLLSKGLGNGYEVERAWGKNSMGAMLQVAVEVRSRLLDFALQLSDKMPKEPAKDRIKQLSQDASIGDLFKNTVFGDNTTIVVGSGNISSTSNNVTKNDFQSLATQLKSHNVSESDIQELERAVKADATDVALKQKKLGPSVTKWVTGMVRKAGTTAWQVSVNAAGDLLGALIRSFYGFGA